MKPSDTLLNTDFYQLSNDGEIEVSLNIPSGTRVVINDTQFDLRLGTQAFNVGNALSDFNALIFDNKSSTWFSGLRKNIMCNMEQVFNGTSYGIAPMPVEISVFRTSGNRFELSAAVTGVGGGGEGMTAEFYLRENLQIRVRVKTFLQPEL